MSFDRDLFLPVSREDMARRGWDDYDILIIAGDAYVDHPSFGPTIIGRLLEDEGYRVAILAQPDWRSPAAFSALGRPRLAVMISAGNLDSMVAHYTAAKKRRHDDAYSPGRRAGLRPDHATVVYSNRVREVFGDIPIIIGGLEASLRRFAHYDYWEDKVRRSILFDAQADILTYGMGERASVEILSRLASGTPVEEITDVRGTCVAARHPGVCTYPKVEVPTFDEVAAASVLPRSRGIGTVDVVVSTHSGKADPALLEQIQAYFQSRREIAVDVQVRAPEQVKVDVAIRLQPAEGSSLETAAAGVEAAVRNWFSGERLGKPVLLAQLYSLIFACDGVANCKLAAPADDVEIAAHQLPVLGTLTVEGLA